MSRFFKQEEKKQFAYSSIEMRKSSYHKFWWFIAVILILFLLAVFYLIH